MSKEELQDYCARMVAMEDRLVEAVRPQLQAAAQKACNAGRHTVPARMLKSFVSCARLAVRDFPLKLRDASTDVALELRGWGPAYRRRIEVLAPQLQDHPDWASYCAQVQWVAATVAGKRLSFVRHRSDPQHYNNREIDKELQPDRPPGFLQQEQQQQQVAGGGAACSQVLQEQQRQRGREQQEQQLTHPHQKGGVAAAVPQPQPAAAACQGPDEAFPLGCYCMRDMLVQIISTAEVRRPLLQHVCDPECDPELADGLLLNGKLERGGILHVQHCLPATASLGCSRSVSLVGVRLLTERREAACPAACPKRRTRGTASCVAQWCCSC